jgi:hypothetical protein
MPEPPWAVHVCQLRRPAVALIVKPLAPVRAGGFVLSKRYCREVLRVNALPCYLSTTRREQALRDPQGVTVSENLISETEFTTREAWLMTAIEHFRPMFEEHGAELPEAIRVSTGWTKRARKGSIGWTWISGAAEDKVNNVFISPEITGAFKQMWQKLGFTGKATCSTPGEELKDTLEALVCIMGEYPHAKMLTGAEGGKGTVPKKQVARQIKYTCETNPDNKVRVSRGNVAKYGAPLCACHQEEMVEAPGQE